jgi:pimeloyl-ACP methyl ester carboxylesterase
VSISAPKGLKGDILTRIIPTDSRSLDEYSIVNQLINQSEETELFYFDAHRSLSGTPNCLEIQNVQNQDILLDDPLVISIKADEDATMMPLTYDGEHFIPLDLKNAENGKFTFELNHLPQRTANRSLTQAIKLFFVKIRGSSTNDQTHLLNFVDYTSGKSSNDKKQFKKRVEDAKNALLLVHGIIGNTKQMVQVAKPLYDSGKFDLIMTFNYENLNTPIEATSGELLEQLKEVGFSEKKKITILSHSMGGLVSRYMIEQLSGSELVKKLVVVGTPHKGSKVAEVGSKYVVQWLPIIFFLVNVVRDFTQVKKIFALASGKLKADKTLNQMTWEDPDRWLKNLCNAPDPKIPYHIIYGNLEDYLDTNDSLKRLMQKVYKLGGKLFYKDDPSDMIVSEDSMTGVPSDRNPAPTKKKVASIHTSYFADEMAIAEIIKVL